MKTISMNEAIDVVNYAKCCTREERLKLQKERLKELVAFARENSPYIRDKYKNLPEDYDLTDIPTSSKKEIVEHYEEWVTDREVNLEDVRQYLDSEDRYERPYLNKYSALTTSGSSGNPFYMVRDSYHNTIHATLMSQRLMRGYGGNVDLSKDRAACLVYPDPHVSSYSSLLRMKRAQKEYADNAIAISPLLPKEEIIKQLNDFNPNVISCYPSVLCQIAHEQAAGNLKINLKGIFCSAELLTQEMYELLTNSFNCPVFNNYCSTEGGEIAMASGCPQLHINEDWVIIEPIDENGEVITSEDKWSSGVLVTDLSNYIQPIIRYRMEDSIRIHTNCACKNSLPYMDIRGREAGLIEFGGRSLRFINIGFLLEDRLGTYAVQVIKKSDHLMELRSMISVADGRDDYLKKAMEIIKEHLDEEGCTNFEIIISMEDPVRNRCGGKVSRYVEE